MTLPVCNNSTNLSKWSSVFSRLFGNTHDGQNEIISHANVAHDAFARNIELSDERDFRLLRRRRRQRERESSGDSILENAAQAVICRSKVVRPLAHAVRLVDARERDATLNALQIAHKVFVQETLGRNEEDF